MKAQQLNQTGDNQNQLSPNEKRLSSACSQTEPTSSQPPLLAPPSYFDTTLSAEPLPLTRIFPDELTENDPRLELFDDRDGSKKGDKKFVDQKEADQNERVTPEEEEGAPDGGWGWCIVLVAFFINTVLDGIAYSCGVYFPVFLDYFQESASKTSWIGSLCSGCYLAISPLAGAATNRYGCKKVSIFGCLWAGLSLLAAAFANSVDLLIITWGISTGCAFGFLYLPSLVIVGLWFDKKRGIATGITVAGTGVGLFVLPPLCTSLIKNFGWRVSLYALSGLVFLCAPLALLYRDVPMKAGPRNSDGEKEKEEGGESKSGEDLENMDPSVAEHSEESNCNNEGNSFAHEGRNGSLPMISVNLVDDEPQNVSTGDLGIPTNDLRRLALRNSKQEHCNSMGSVNPSASNGAYAKAGNVKSLDDLRNRNSTCLRMFVSSSRPNVPETPDTLASRQNVAYLKEPLRKKNIFYSASTLNLTPPPVEANSSLTDVSFTPVDSGKEEAGEDEKYSGDSDSRVHKRLHPNRFLGGILQMLGVEVFKDPCFLLLLFQSVVIFFGFFTPFMYMTDYAVLEGVDLNSASFLISITGIANTIGRPIIGLIVAMKWLDSVVIFNFSAVVCGALTLALPFLGNYWMIALYASLFGLCVAGHVTTLPLAITQLMGVKNLSNGLGYRLLASGVASMIGVPVIGLLYDKETGSYTACFITAGIVMMVGGLLGLPLQRLSDRQRKRYPERYVMQPYSVKLNDSGVGTSIGANDVTCSNSEVSGRSVNNTEA